MLSRNVGNEITNLRCVKSRKSASLRIYTSNCRMIVDYYPSGRGRMLTWRNSVTIVDFLRVTEIKHEISERSASGLSCDKKQKCYLIVKSDFS